MFMNEDDKKIYSMVQRLSQLEKQSLKDKKAKDKARTEVKNRREKKVDGAHVESRYVRACACCFLHSPLRESSTNTRGDDQ